MKSLDAVGRENENLKGDSKCCKGNLFRYCLYVVIMMLVLEVMVSLSVHKKTYHLLQRMRVIQSDASVISQNLGFISRLLNVPEDPTDPLHDYNNNSSSSIDIIEKIPELAKAEFFSTKCDILKEMKISDLNNTLYENCSQICPETPPKLVGSLATYKDSPTFDKIEKEYPWLQPGGRYSPSECVSRQSVAVIIPYRNREIHLRTFLYNIHPILQRQQLDYGIYVVDQAEGSTFNRAMLMNIGYAEAIKVHNYSCFIFHDVDLIPENDRNLYRCSQNPRHMSAAVNKFSYRLPYNTIFGGVSGISRKTFERVNGFSNVFFGWGGEDDDMWNRLGHHGFKVVRYPLTIARYKMISHGRDKGNNPNGRRMKLLNEGRKRFSTDGINSLKYQVLKLEFNKTFTRIYVQVNEQEIMKAYRKGRKPKRNPKRKAAKL